MLAAVAPAAVRRVRGWRRGAPRPGVGKWRFSETEVDRAPLLLLWDSLVSQSRTTTRPLWSTPSTLGRDGEGAAGGSDVSGRDRKEAGGGILEAVREEGALKEEFRENAALGKCGKIEMRSE